MTINLDIDEFDTDEPAPLYHHYSSEYYAQPAYVEMDSDGNVIASYSSQTGSYNLFDDPSNIVLRWKIPSAVNGRCLFNTLHSEKVMTLLENIHLGHDVDWNPSTNDYVGSLDEEAQSAFEELKYILQDLECDEAIHAADVDINPILEHWPSGSIESAAEAFVDDAASDMVLIYGDIEVDFVMAVKEIFDKDQPGLTYDHLNKLVEEGEIDSEEADDYANRWISVPPAFQPSWR